MICIFVHISGIFRAYFFPYLTNTVYIFAYLLHIYCIFLTYNCIFLANNCIFLALFCIFLAYLCIFLQDPFQLARFRAVPVPFQQALQQ